MNFVRKRNALRATKRYATKTVNCELRTKTKRPTGYETLRYENCEL